MEPLAISVHNGFLERFGVEPLIVRAPGRVNIIGEHTDYNEGFVLPAAIDKSICVGIARRDHGNFRLYSGEFKEEFVRRVEETGPTGKDWPDYILGVIAQVRKKELPLQGFDLYFDGDVPIGAGMSSSAALECATLLALDRLFQYDLPKLEMARMAQKAEHEYAGVLCGIMDQFASLFGKKDHLIRLDCRSLEHVHVPMRLEGIRIVLFNTNVKHSLASSAYNERRRQCEEGVAMIRAHVPEVISLRDVSLELLDRYVAHVDPLVYRRCRYVVEENERLLEGCKDLEQGNMEKLGEKMFASHDGLSNEYEVSCKELDFLVDYVRGNENVLGARMMGGGFGGCTINLIREQAIESLQQEIEKAYEKAMGLQMTTYVAGIEEGASVIPGPFR